MAARPSLNPVVVVPTLGGPEERVGGDSRPTREDAYMFGRSAQRTARLQRRAERRAIVLAKKRSVMR